MIYAPMRYILQTNLIPFINMPNYPTWIWKDIPLSRLLFSEYQIDSCLQGIIVFSFFHKFKNINCGKQLIFLKFYSFT